MAFYFTYASIIDFRKYSTIPVMNRSHNTDKNELLSL